MVKAHERQRGADRMMRSTQDRIRGPSGMALAELQASLPIDQGMSPAFASTAPRCVRAAGQRSCVNFDTVMWRAKVRS